ncbi:MAG: hypothetical protein KF810_02820 [Rhizobiaceae bacterium]|nr:hypothetical protein [Rhizobiaceae bacterium]
MMLSLAACGTTNPLAGVYGDKARSDQVGAALGVAEAEIAAARKVPKLGPECRQRFRIGAKPGDGYDVVAKKADLALSRANDRLAHCVALSDRYSEARGAKP